MVKTVGTVIVGAFAAFGGYMALVWAAWIWEILAPPARPEPESPGTPVDLEDLYTDDLQRELIKQWKAGSAKP